MPRSKRRNVERVTIRLPKPMTDGIDRIVKEHAQYGWNRQRFVETAIAELIMKVNSTGGILLLNETYALARKYYEEHEEELRTKYGVKNITDFLNFCVRNFKKERIF